MKRRSFVQGRELFLPLAGLAACLAGRAESAAALLGAYLLVRLCALCPDGAYLRAAADELNKRALARFRKTAALMLLLGAALSALALWHFVRPLELMAERNLLLTWLAAVLLLGCRSFIAFLTADGERGSAALGEFLLAALLLTAMLLGAPGWSFAALTGGAAAPPAAGWGAPLLCAGAAALAFLICWIVVASVAPPAARGLQRPAARMFARAPMALLRELLCPALLAAMALGSGPELLPAALAGWALFAASTSLYRRSPAETPPLAAALVPCAAALMALVVLPALCPEVAWPAALRALAAARLFGLPAAALPIALAALLALLFNAHFSPAVAVCMLLLAAQAALTCVPELGGLTGGALSLIAGSLAVLAALPLYREALLPARAQRRRQRLRRGN